MFEELNQLLNNPKINHDYDFLRFISISLMILPQNDIFKNLQNYLEVNYISVRKQNKRVDEKQKEFFGSYLRNLTAEIINEQEKRPTLMNDDFISRSSWLSKYTDNVNMNQYSNDLSMTFYTSGN